MADLENELPRLACPSCASLKSPLEFTGQSLHCRSCGLSFPVKDRIPVLLLSEASKGRLPDEYSAHMKTDTETIGFYDGLYQRQNDYTRYRDADAAFVKKIFKKLALGPGAMLLDLGAGTGYFGKLIEEQTGAEVYNADFSIEGFRTARQVYGLQKLFVTDAYNPGFRAEVFDAIFAIGLTPFKKSEPSEIKDLLGRILRPLKSGGVFVFVYSTDCSGRIRKGLKVDATNKSRAIKSEYYNHTRRFMAGAFERSGYFSKVEGCCFLRPLASYGGNFLFSRFSTVLTELVMRMTLGVFSARLMIVGRKK